MINLSQITKEDAINQYMKGQPVKILCKLDENFRMCLYDLEEIFRDAIFFVESDNKKLSNQDKDFVTINENKNDDFILENQHENNIKENEPDRINKGNESDKINKDDVVSEPVNIYDSRDEENDDNFIYSTDKKLSNKNHNDIVSKYNLQHMNNNDVKTDVEDYEDDEPLIKSDHEDNTSLDLKPKKRKGKKRTVDLGKLFALKRARWKIKDIARELGCSVATVNRYINNKELEDEILNMQKH